MAKSILEALFYGKLTPWERQVPLSDDLKRLEGLEDLYAQASEDKELAIFSRGFIMGALIMLEVLAGREDIISE